MHQPDQATESATVQPKPDEYYGKDQRAATESEVAARTRRLPCRAKRGS